jgi:hypothetical protein
MKQKNRYALILAAAIARLSFSCDQQPEKKDAPTNTASEPVNQQQNKTSDKNVLAGDWVRTDAEYRIQISELLDGGMMKAGYFNPKSINVGKASWASADGVLRIYIELSDENYPGSNYTLVYYPEKDMLAGKYFQAVERVTYDVGFLRKK